MKARLEVLEKLFDTLQNQALEDAERLLQRIRSAAGLSSVLSLGGDDSGDAIPLSSGPSNQPPTSPTSSSASGRPCSSSFMPQSDGNTRDSFSRPPQVRGSLSRLSSASSTSSQLSKDVSDTSTLHARMVLPNQDITKRAVDSFFASTGQLFHVFSRGQVASYLEDIYGSASLSTSLPKKAVCCVACVAAVGVQYKADDFDHGLEAIFYDVARRHFADVFEDRPLESIKVCTLLAMYNIMNKAMVSVAYIGKFLPVITHLFAISVRC